MFHDNELSHTNSVDTAVIGGGLAGLTAAVYLAQAGQRVIVLEKAKQWGGRASTKQQDDFLFNLGPHALYIGGGGSQILEEVGVSWSGGTPNANGLAIRQNQAYTLPGAPKTLIGTKLLTVRQKAAFMGLMARAMSLTPESVAHLSVQAWLQQQTKSKQVQQVFQALARLATYTNAPEQLSAAIFLHQLQLALRHNVRYLHGGWQTLVAGLRQVGAAQGVTFMIGSRAAAVTETAAGVTIALADGGTVTAAAAILAVDPHTASQLVPSNPSLQQWAKTAVPIQAACLDVALRRLPRPQHNFALGIDQPLYLSNHSAVAQLSEKEGHVIHVAKYLPLHQTDSAADKAELEALLDVVQPGWRAEVITHRFLPQMTVINRLATAESGGLNGRPGYAVPHSHRLYLAGDWVGSQGWLADASLISARQAAHLILAQPAKATASRKASLQSVSL